MNTTSSFPVARYRFEFEVRQPIRLPDYAGSMLRGAFGHALRQLACMTRQKDCAACPLIASCPYPAVFAPPPPTSHRLQQFSQLPVPYVIEPPAWGSRVLAEGETLIFHQVLIGKALQELPLIILAWRRAFARGVGAGDGTADLRRVIHCGDAGEHEIHRPEIGTIATHAQTVVLKGTDDSATPGAAVLHFETPLRLHMLVAWRESSLYSPRERAALAWTEALTLVAQTGAPDADWEAVKAEFSEDERAWLSMAVAAINMWNRIQVGFRAAHPTELPHAA